MDFFLVVANSCLVFQALRVQKLVPDMLQANLSREQQPFFC